MSPRPTRACWNAALLSVLVLIAPACAKKTSGPRVNHVAVSGTAFDVGGLHVTDADVYLTELGGSGDLTVTFPDTSSGRFEFANVGEGRYALGALTTHSTVAVDTIDVPRSDAAQTVTHDLSLVTGGAIRGRVTLNGETAFDATTVIAAPALTAGFTDSTGAFLVGDVPPGSWAVTAYHQDFVDTTFTVAVAAPGDTVTLPVFGLRRGPVTGPAADRARRTAAIRTGLRRR